MSIAQTINVRNKTNLPVMLVNVDDFEGIGLFNSEVRIITTDLDWFHFWNTIAQLREIHKGDRANIEATIKAHMDDMCQDAGSFKAWLFDASTTMSFPNQNPLDRAIKIFCAKQYLSYGINSPSMHKSHTVDRLLSRAKANIAGVHYIDLDGWVCSIDAFIYIDCTNLDVDLHLQLIESHRRRHEIVCKMPEYMSFTQRG